jgi:predicted transglutaminase-like cysteine proteinase
MPNSKTLLATLAFALALAVSAAPSAAGTVDLSNPAFAPTMGLTSIPVGHSEFCKAHRDECGTNRQVADVTELTDERWALLIGINNEMNSNIVPVSDNELYQVAELWTYPAGYGDCEDIALAKRRALISAGWDPSTLLMAVVREQNGEGHAVLMVRTDRGDLVLDNQDGMVRVWNETPYQFIKRQSQQNAGDWVDILDERTLVVAAAH